ncbi:Choline/Carnitine O-acyltransferase [Cooperia oncophora]
MAFAIERSYSEYSKLRDDVDVAATLFRDFGKGLIKKCGLSPDAFVQMAIQLANYRDQQRFVLTYEAASARFYKNSRTETLRTKDEKIAKLRKACAVHTNNNREAMVGRAVDRHLFVLYVLSQGTLISSPFLDHYISQQWLLSTSHVPNVTNQIDEDTEPWRTWTGACFGAVAKNGYGVCYRFGGNHGIFAHVTSYKSAENTASSSGDYYSRVIQDSARFRNHLTTAFKEMAALFQEAK